MSNSQAKVFGTMVTHRKLCSIWSLLVIEGFLLLTIASAVHSYTTCFNRATPDIPSDHLFNTKKKPLIIGHRGQPRVYQENSLEGVKSLTKLGADGYEIDIYLTNSGQLVAFHDDNALKLTGVNKNIWDMTPSEISNLSYKDTLTYGKLQYSFPKRLKIALLEDILNATKNTNLFMYLEMKPGHIVRRSTKRSVSTGKAVAKMVTRLGLEKRAFLVSFDPLKSHAAKEENPNLVVGTFYEESYWHHTPSEYQAVAQALKALPGMTACLSQLPFDRRLTDFLFEKGSVFKSMNASFVDMQYTIYDNPVYSNNTFDTLRLNYNPKISAGAWTIYSMKLNATETDATEKRVQNLIDGGAERLITDDVTRLRKKLGRDRPSKGFSMQSTTEIQFACFICITFLRILNI